MHQASPEPETKILTTGLSKKKKRLGLLLGDAEQVLCFIWKPRSQSREKEQRVMGIQAPVLSQKSLVSM